jgi:hypothetical protein
MAIVQISQITNRLGLNTDLPQLAGAELGWSTDTRQLYIGNGTLEQGAPVIGNTEILTEFSDIINLAATYTYKGTAAGYTVQTGPTSGTPVALSLQTWLDQFATVKDFGAMGDGLTDDTAAINRALYQLYCRQDNVQIRRSLFFPAGKYVISGPINIPPYATLYGEGPKNSIIQMVVSGGTGSFVAQTADNQQQTGVNIGNNGATLPTDITIGNMAFQSLDSSKSVFSVQSATNCEFRGVSFIGPETTTTLANTTVGTTCGVVFGSTVTTTSNILFDGCRFTGTWRGASTDQKTTGVTINNSNFNILYRGVTLGTGTIVNGGPTGTRITNNMFDNIFSSGIFFGDINLNATGYNIFYDVANHFQGTANPEEAVIVFQGNNNASVGDMFERSDVYANIITRINTGVTTSISTTNGSQIKLGVKTVDSGLVAILQENIDPVSPDTIFTIDTQTTAPSFKIDYSATRPGNLEGTGNVTGYRTGTLWVSSSENGIASYMDDYTENYDLGVNLVATQITNIGELDNVIIANTAGGFTSENNNVSEGQVVTISGNFANTIGEGNVATYPAQSIYFVIGANSNTSSFVLSSTQTGANIVTTAGNTTNAIFTLGTISPNVKIAYNSTPGDEGKFYYSTSYLNI